MELLGWISISHFLLLALPVKLVVANPLMYNTTLAVTGFFGPANWHEMVVCNANASWFDAFHECESIDHSIATASASGDKFVHLRNYLFRYHPEFIGVPLWTGHLKPNLDEVWYLRNKCHKTVNEDVRNTFVNNTIGERQCLLVNMSLNTAQMAYTWYATSCYEQHPFICELNLGGRPVEPYEGMQLQDVDRNTSVTTSGNITVEDCIKSMKLSAKTFIAEYNSTSEACTLYKRSVFELPYEVNLAVISADNITISFLKSEENVVTVLPLPDAVYTNIYAITDLPCYDYEASTATTCVPIPSSTDVFFGMTTATLDISSSLNQWIEVVKKETVVDEKTLSSYRNKRVSATDSRASSQAMGVLGAIFIASVILLILLSDLPKIIPQIQHKAHQWKPDKTKRKSNTLFSKMKNRFNRRNSV